jgi:hypothetical protein
MRKITITFLVIALLSVANIASAVDKPDLYNLATEPNTDIDEAVFTCMAKHFNIIDIHDSKAYVPPKPIAGSLPRYALTNEGEQLSGYVLVGYAINPEGFFTKPCIIKTTDKRLNSFALEAMNEWRFNSGKVNGKAVTTAAAQEFNFEAPTKAITPNEFVTQVLEPTGGKISRPKDWFYYEAHRGPSYTWTISREEASTTPYITGVRIQTFVGVQKNTGKSGKQFVLDFAARKKKEASKVIKYCSENDQGLFTRICFETEEGPYHILYSLFWGSKNLDVVVISISGTTKKLWDIYKNTFDKMSAFELIDMKRFEK